MSEKRELRMTLDSGSSKVFNCLKVTQALLKENPQHEGFMFRCRELNRIVVIKEGKKTQGGFKRIGASSQIFTKVYFPYNEGDPYEGGLSIYRHDPTFADALLEQCGLDRDEQPEVFQHDTHLLRVIDQTPSLDPFLIKDRLQQEKIQVHPAYLKITEKEWQAIQAYIRKRFDAIVRFAFPDAKNQTAKADALIDKLWEATDMEALGPIIAAFKLDPERASEILYAWKGITFFHYEFGRTEAKTKAFAGWLGKGSMPLDMARGDQKDPSGGAAQLPERQATHRLWRHRRHSQRLQLRLRGSLRPQAQPGEVPGVHERRP